MCDDGWYAGAAEWNEGDDPPPPLKCDGAEKLECGVKPDDGAENDDRGALYECCWNDGDGCDWNDDGREYEGCDWNDEGREYEGCEAYVDGRAPFEG